MSVNPDATDTNCRQAKHALGNQPLSSVAVLLIAFLSLLSLTATPASAEFTRPYLTQITGTTGEHGEPLPFPGELEGLAVDPDPLDENVFVGVGEAVDEFSSLNVFMPPPITGVGTRSLAFDGKSGKLVGGEREEYVAVDNSLKQPEVYGDVYRAGLTGAPSEGRGTVVRVTESGAPAPFTCTAEHHEEYVKENELTGKPGETWTGTSNPVSGVAVDSGSGASAGDIYVINDGGQREGNQVDEFTSEGCFVRAITSANVPETHVFNGSLYGIAVDPTDGDVLVEAEVGFRYQAIYEFTESGEFLGKLTGSSRTDQFGEAGLYAAFGDGIAVSSGGALYVHVREYTEKEYDEAAEKKKATFGRYVVDEFGLGAYFPSAVTGGVSNDRSTSAVLNGVVRGTANAEHVDLPLFECGFEYVSEEDFVKKGAEGGFHSATIAPCVLESGSSPVGQALEEKNYAVHGEVSGLKEGEVYDYRLVAGTSVAEHGGSQVGEVESVAAAAAPAVEAVSVGDVSSSSADFDAKIDPRGSDTTYQFQYVEAGAYEVALAAGAADPYLGGGSVPVPADDVGSGDRYLSVSAQASGLLPGIAYDYRLVASNGAGEESVKGVFATVPEGLRGLPDGRAYELVTPADKGGAEDMFGTTGFWAEENLDHGFASQDGEHFLLMTRAAFGPFPASGEGAYVFSRGAHGWSFKSVVSPALGIQNVNDLVFDPADLLMVGVVNVVGAGTEHSVFDLDGPPGGPYAAASSGTPEAPNENVVEVGASTDLSRVLLQSGDHKLAVCEGAQQELAEKLDADAPGLYEWTAARGCLSLVDVESQSEGGGLINRCGAALGLGQRFAGVAHGAVSVDGSRIVFTAPAPFNEQNGSLAGPGCWDESVPTVNPPELYVRVKGETTVEVSAPEKEGETVVRPPAMYPAMYVGASENGAQVFFLTRTELTSEAVGLGLHEPELYEYDSEAPEGKRLTRVSRGDLPSGPVEGKVLDVPAVSGDASEVYFNAEAELTPGHQGGLYRYDTDTDETAYVAPEQNYPTRELG